MARRRDRPGRKPAVADARRPKARSRREVDFTLECSGNNGTGLPFATGFIGNARWAGTPLAPVLEEAGLLKDAIEVVFYGIDRGTLTIRDNSGIVSGGRRGPCSPTRTAGRTDNHRAVRPQHVDRRCARPPQPALLRNERRAATPQERVPGALDRPGLVWSGQRQVADAHRGARPAPCGELHGAGLRDHPRGAARRRTLLDVQHREA